MTVSADGYLDTVTTLDVSDGTNEVEVALPGGYAVSINTSSANLRGGPGTAYESIGVVYAEDVLEVVGRSENEEWLVVQTADE